MIIINTECFLINSNGHTYKAVQLKCEDCSDIRLGAFHTYKNQTTHKCKTCSAKGRNNFNRLGKPPTNAQIKCLVSCDFCNKLTKSKTKRNLEKQSHSFCNASCQVKWQNKFTAFNKGTNNPSYKNGDRVDGKIPNYGAEFTTALKRSIKVRDGYNYQRCELNFSGKLSFKLDVHHIDENKDNNHPSNLTCLCKKCHTKTHWEIGK